MDPDAALKKLFEAILDGDREAYTEALEALSQWNEKGGFMPTTTSLSGGYTLVKDD